MTTLPVPAVFQIEATNNVDYSKTQPKRRTGFMEVGLVHLVDWSATEYTELQFQGEPTLHRGITAIIRAIQSYGVRVGLTSDGSRSRPLAVCSKLADHVTMRPTGCDAETCDDKARRLPHEPPPCTTPLHYVSIQWNGDVVPCCRDDHGDIILGNLYRQTLPQIANGFRRREFLQTIRDRTPNGLCEYCTAPNPHRRHEAILASIKSRKPEAYTELR